MKNEKWKFNDNEKRKTMKGEKHEKFNEKGKI